MPCYDEPNLLSIFSQVQDNEMWSEAEELMSLATDAKVLLRMCDSDMGALSEVHYRMCAMNEKLESASVDHLDDDTRVEMAESVTRRWAYMHGDVHACAYALDPEYCSQDMSGNAEVMRGFNNLRNKTLPTICRLPRVCWHLCR